MFQKALLTDRRVICVKGDDARDFLQGLITNNMEKLPSASGTGIHAGLLTPQGKIMFEFFVISPLDRENEFWLDCRYEVIGELIKRLTFYKLRAAVEITDISDQVQVKADWSEADKIKSKMGFAITDPRLEDLGLRVYLTENYKEELSSDQLGGVHVWHARRIEFGVPEGGLDFGWSEVFPHEANFDLLEGVDFKKGCYVGQEVVSRMQHKTTIRKRFMPVELEAGNLEVKFGDEIRAGESLIGHLGSVAGNRAIALVRFDRLKKAKEKKISVQVKDREVQVMQPNWAEGILVDV